MQAPFGNYPMDSQRIVLTWVRYSRSKNSINLNDSASEQVQKGQQDSVAFGGANPSSSVAFGRAKPANQLPTQMPDRQNQQIFEFSIFY